MACRLAHWRGEATPASDIRATPNSTPDKFKPVFPGLLELTPTNAFSCVPPTRNMLTEVALLLPESTTDWVLFSMAKLPLKPRKPKA